MSTRAEKNIHPTNLKKEMWGIALLGLAALLGGGLLSLQLGNGRLMGPFGQLLSLGLYSLIGMGSYLIIAALFSISWGIFTARFNLHDVRLWLGYTGATLAGTVLLFLLFPSYRLEGISAGGKTGELVGSLGITLFSRVGTLLITGTGLILFLVLATQTSPARGVRTIVKLLSTLTHQSVRAATALGSALVSLFAWESPEEETTGEPPLHDNETPTTLSTEAEQATPSPALHRQSTTCTTAPMEIQAPLLLAKKRTPQQIQNMGTVVPKKASTAPHKGSSELLSSPEPSAPTAGAEETVCAVVHPPREVGVEANHSPTAPIEEQHAPKIQVCTTDDELIVERIAEFKDEKGEFLLPDPELLQYQKNQGPGLDKSTMLALSERMVAALHNYKITGRVTEIHPGPVVTMYEFAPEAGTRVSKIESLNKDLALSLAATRVRIVAPIPGKAAVGIEVPNTKRNMVFLKEGIADRAFQESTSKLTMVLGKDIKGKNISCDLAKAPHLLVAGATGSGKSVGVNTMIMSILFRATPRDVRFIMIDPKMVELSIYNDIPHLLLPVVTDPQKANLALQWAVKEMERRYQLLSDLKVRNLTDYNARIEELTTLGIEETPEHLPAIVVVIDEFADLMMVAAKEVEIAVARIAQKARAVGIHLILATQRPSTDVITGLIKSNFPSRIAYMVSSKIDSKVVLDKHGAETLLGNGDMLYSNRGLEPTRVHGSYVSTREIQEVVEHLKSQGVPDYDLSIVEAPQEEGVEMEDEPYDTKWDLALDIVSRDRIASISYIQRKLKIGYNRAARMVERMQFEGIVSPPNGTNQREVLIPPPPDL